MYMLKGLGSGKPMIFVPNAGTITTGTQPGTTVTTTPPPGAVVSTEAPFYTTWWGMGLIAVGAYFGYKKFIKKA